MVSIGLVAEVAALEALLSFLLAVKMSQIIILLMVVRVLQSTLQVLRSITVVAVVVLLSTIGAIIQELIGELVVLVAVELVDTSTVINMTQQIGLLARLV